MDDGQSTSSPTQQCLPEGTAAGATAIAVKRGRKHPRHGMSARATSSRSDGGTGSTGFASYFDQRAHTEFTNPLFKAGEFVEGGGIMLLEVCMHLAGASATSADCALSLCPSRVAATRLHLGFPASSLTVQ